MVDRDVGGGWKICGYESETWGPCLNHEKKGSVEVDHDGDLYITLDERPAPESLFIPIDAMRELIKAHDEWAVKDRARKEEEAEREAEIKARQRRRDDEEARGDYLRDMAKDPDHGKDHR